MPKKLRKIRRRISFEILEGRQLLATDCGAWLHNLALPEDVNTDQLITPADALTVINYLNASPERNVCAMGEGEAIDHIDVNNDQWISADSMFYW